MNKIIKLSIMTIFIALFTGCSDDYEKKTYPIPLLPPQRQVKEGLLILQAYGSSSSAAGATRSFVELYNKSGNDIDLNGVFLYYADGVRNTGDNWAAEDNAWKRIELSGTVPARCSFLILGPVQNTTGRYQIPEEYGDIVDENFTLSNRAFKTAIIRGNTELTVQNPFDTDGRESKAAGYIDMVGAVNNADEDSIYGYETMPARCSASVAVRRIDLNDTDINSKDFKEIDYRLANGMTDEKLIFYGPKNLSKGPWDPFGTTLLIFQVYGAGFGEELGSDSNINTGSVSHNFIELYNNSDTPVDLNGYSVQWANGKADGGGTVIPDDEDWNVINLTGTIPAYGSYLIRGRKMNDENGIIGRLQITTADIDDNNFYMSNRSFKVALVSNQTKLTEAQPWDNDSDPPGPKAGTGLVDLVGARNGNKDSTVGFEGAVCTDMSKQKAVRRRSTDDFNNNSSDFIGVDYRTADLEKYRPRTAANGSWTPEF